MACDIETLLTDACANGFNCLPSERAYDIVLAQLLCDILDAGGGGGTATQVLFKGNYGGGTPTDTPTGSEAIAYDLDPPNSVWYWNGSAWT